MSLLPCCSCLPVFWLLFDYRIKHADCLIILSELHESDPFVVERFGKVRVNVGGMSKAVDSIDVFPLLVMMRPMLYQILGLLESFLMTEFMI